MIKIVILFLSTYQLDNKSKFIKKKNLKKNKLKIHLQFQIMMTQKKYNNKMFKNLLKLAMKQ